MIKYARPDPEREKEPKRENRQNKRKQNIVCVLYTRHTFAKHQTHIILFAARSYCERKITLSYYFPPKAIR